MTRDPSRDSAHRYLVPDEPDHANSIEKFAEEIKEGDLNNVARLFNNARGVCSAKKFESHQGRFTSVFKSLMWTATGGKGLQNVAQGGRRQCNPYEVNVLRCSSCEKSQTEYFHIDPRTGGIHEDFCTKCIAKGAAPAIADAASKMDVDKTDSGSDTFGPGDELGGRRAHAERTRMDCDDARRDRVSSCPE